MPSLNLDGLSKAFGGLQALHPVDIDIPVGRVTGLIGPNGAGKTTVVNLVTGMLAVSTGTIRFDETDITRSQPHEIGKLGVSRTFQNIRLLPRASVLDNVALGYYRQERASLLDCLLNLGTARRETKRGREAAHQMLEKFGLANYANQPAGALSYGHQRRIEMSRALVGAPRALLLDEPVAGMNDVEAAELGEIFLDVARSGVAVLLIEHNMRFVSRVCDEIYVLDGGKLIARGQPKSVLSDPIVIKAYLGGKDAEDQ